MTNVQPHRIVNNSVSPAVSSEVAPVYGLGTELADEPVLGSEAMASGAGSASGSRDEKNEKDEKDESMKRKAKGLEKSGGPGSGSGRWRRPRGR